MQDGQASKAMQVLFSTTTVSPLGQCMISAAMDVLGHNAFMCILSDIFEPI